MNREACLEQATKCVCTDRNETYGQPEDSFAFIAKLWGDYLGSDYLIDAKDVAVMMMLLKIARIATGKHNPDNYIDIAGYAACGCEIGDFKRKTTDKLHQVAPTCASDYKTVTNWDYYVDEIESVGDIESLAMSGGIIGRCIDEIKCEDCDFDSVRVDCVQNRHEWLNAPYTDQKTEKEPVVTNGEFCAKEIVTKWGHQFIAKVNDKVSLCSKTDCCDCDFNNANSGESCVKNIRKWLNEPHIFPEKER